jgi:hypothetical protein
MHVALCADDPFDVEIRKAFGMPFRDDIFAHDGSAVTVDQ